MQTLQFNKKISILMPAYNEAENIERVVRKSIATLVNLGLEGEVVVANDGSLDNTKSILERLKKEITNLVVIEHKQNMGYGAALNSAIKAAGGEVFVTIDSDGQFDIGELPLLLDLYQRGSKVVAGYRKEKKDSLIKVLANKCLNLLINVMFGLNLKDVNSAFKLYESGIIKSLEIESRGYQAPAEIMVKLKTLGHSIAEVGITHAYREKGRSALGTVKTTFHMLVFFVYLKLREYLYRKKIINNF